MTPEREQEIRSWLRVIRERGNVDNPTYLTVTDDEDPAEFEEQFNEKFGEYPQETFNQFGLLWAGPVP